MAPSFSKETILIFFYKIINVFSCILIEASKDTRSKHNKKFRQIGHSTRQHGQSFPPKTIT